jgi:hypothetical protein
VTASNFRDREQLALFGGGEDPRRHATAEALDVIRRKYGERAVTRARLVRAALPSPFERDPNTPVEHRQGLRRATPTDAPTDPRNVRGKPADTPDRDSLDDTDAPEDLDTDA